MAIGIAVDAAGNLYIAGANAVRKVTPNGIISLVAGNYTSGFSGDGGAATIAQLADPLRVAVDSAGNLYIADSENNRVRKVSPSGVISTFAGGGSAGADKGDGGPATAATLNGLADVALDSSGAWHWMGAEICISRIAPITGYARYPPTESSQPWRVR